MEADEAKPIPDLILLDLNTPRTDGIAVLRQMKRSLRLGKVPVVVVSSSVARADRQSVEDEGARHVPKPAQLTAFLCEMAGIVKETLGPAGEQR